MKPLEPFTRFVQQPLRFWILLAAFTGILLIGIALALGAFTTGNAQQVQPLGDGFVGTWTLPSDDPEQSPSILTLHADGTLINSQVAPGGNTAYQGVWVATSEDSATFTMKNFAGDNTTFEYIGDGTIRGTIELSEDDTLLAQGTLEAVAKSGEREFLVSLETKGIRMHIEPSPKN